MCTSCGMPSSGNSCSMCYGDVNHGDDGYYQAYMEEQERANDEFLKEQHEEETQNE